MIHIVTNSFMSFRMEIRARGIDPATAKRVTLERDLLFSWAKHIVFLPGCEQLAEIKEIRVLARVYRELLGTTVEGL
jgi:hypothetical protein